MKTKRTLKHRITLLIAPFFIFLPAVGCAPGGAENDPSGADATVVDAKNPGADADEADAEAPDAFVDPCDPGPHTVGAVTEKPQWAANELEAFAAFETVIDTFFDKFADPQTGELYVGGFSWYNWDDVMEGEAVLDKFLLIAGRQDQRDLYSLIYKYHHQIAIDRGWLDATHNFYTQLYDAEHTVEALMYLWGALEVTPNDPQLRAWNESMASWLMTEGPFNAQTEVFKSCRLGTNAGSGGEQADTLLNLAYTYPVIRAWMTSGDDTYRQWVADYTHTWASAAIESGPFAGVLPFQIHSETLEPGPLTDGHWWQGGGEEHMEGFDYETYGFACIGRSTHGAVVAQQLADPQNPSLAEALASTLGAFAGANPQGPPTDSYDPANGGFYRLPSNYNRYLPRQFAATHSVLMSQTSQELVDDYVDVRDHGDIGGGERTWLNWMAFTFNRLLGPSVPADLFENTRQNATTLVGEIANLSKTDGHMPADGDELRVYAPSFSGIDYVDGAMAGKRNRRDGAPSPAPVRYYKADGEMGLPTGVAALVRHQTQDTVELWLYNDNDSASTVVVMGGHYGQHTIARYTETDSQNEQAVGCNHVFLSLPAGALAQITLTLERFTQTPSLTPYADSVAP
jgi:hypothetical protein